MWEAGTDDHEGDIAQLYLSISSVTSCHGRHLGLMGLIKPENAYHSIRRPRKSYPRTSEYL